MKYLFILGRNLELSISEIKNYLEKTNRKILNNSLNKNGFLVEIDKKLNENEIDFLGGIISIGEVVCEIKDLDKIEIYLGEKNNINYSVWNFSEKFNEIRDYLKKRFRKEKLKAVFKPSENSSKVDEEYFVFEDYFGKIVQKCDYKNLEKRDMNKPIRRESLAISPRLAKIMINLSQVKENETLLDCFCGIGVILQEALLQNIRVIGIDKNKNAISGAQQNLNWFSFLKENYKLINFDSKKVEVTKANVLVSEPDLGEVLKKIPTKEKAERILNGFENLMIGVLNNLKKVVSERIVFTSPLIRIGKKRIGCNIEKICELTGLKLIEGSFDDFREKQIVGRRIFVLGK